MTAAPHPIRVINGKRYSDFPAADHISWREWVAFVFLVTGLLFYVLVLLGGAAWVVWKVVRLWQ